MKHKISEELCCAGVLRNLRFYGGRRTSQSPKIASKDRERRVTHLIASEAQEAFFFVDNEIKRNKKREHSFTLGEEMRVLEEPDALGHAVASCEVPGTLRTNRWYSKSWVSKT